jgi:hypothetical protein
MNLAVAPQLVRQVSVFGTGHLAMATRVELIRVGLHRDSDYQLPQLLSPLFIACTDLENDPTIAEVALRASEARAPILFACLTVPMLRIGPLVEPPDSSPSRIRHPRIPSSTAESASVAEPDLQTGICARVGGLLIAAQALSFLQGARAQCVLGTRVEVYPLSIESKAYRVLKVRQ